VLVGCEGNTPRRNHGAWGTRRPSPQAPKKPHQLNLWTEAQDAPQSFWQRRFYDFNVWSQKKKIEKLHYMHMNPVKRGLVTDPKLWPWSSYRFYQFRETGFCNPDIEAK
jgi:hypothetical protein